MTPAVTSDTVTQHVMRVCVDYHCNARCSCQWVRGWIPCLSTFFFCLLSYSNFFFLCFLFSSAHRFLIIIFSLGASSLSVSCSSSSLLFSIHKRYSIDIEHCQTSTLKLHNLMYDISTFSLRYQLQRQLQVTIITSYDTILIELIYMLSNIHSSYNTLRVLKVTELE
jgi:hypothetical protein